MKYIAIILSTTILFATFISCNNSQKKSKKKSEIEIEPNLDTLVYKWNDAHNNSDYKLFSELYYNEVVFYTAILSNSACTEKKKSLLSKFDDFHQTIGELSIEEISDKEFKCSFIKTCTMNGNSFEYPSYLIFTKTRSGWKISTESDLVSDENIAKMNLPKNAVAGDFNSDGAPEMMWLEAPKFPKNQNDENFGECEGDCICYIKFSDENIPPILVKTCIGGYPVNEGDLNNDGSDEIGILPDWWTSYWKGYFVYTLKNGQWEYLVEPVSTHFSQWREGVDAITKDPNNPGYVIINYSEITMEDIVILSKTIKVN